MKKIILILSIVFTIQMNAQQTVLGIADCYNLTSVMLPTPTYPENTWWVTYTPTANANVGRRGFSISIPTGISNATKKPVVIYNHADETVVQTADFVTGLYTKRNPTNRDDKFVLVCTQAATDVYGNKLYANVNEPYTIFQSYNLGLTFYNKDSGIDVLKASVQDEIKYLNIVIQMLQKGITSFNKLDNDRIYMVGYSGGAMLTQIAATKLNNSIAAFASVAGHKSDIIDPNFKGTKNFKVPMLLINADADPSMEYDNIKAQNLNFYWTGHPGTVDFWMNVNNVELKASTYVSLPFVFYNPNPNIKALRKDYKIKNTNTTVNYFKTFVIEGGGHHWHRPGGFADNNYPGLETNKLCRKINTTNEVWNFLKNHKKSKNGPDVPNGPILVVARTANPNLFDDTELLTENSNNVLVYNSQDNHNLTVELNNFKSANYTFSILNMNGSIVKKEVINSTNEKLFELNLDISDLPKGIYILQIGNENEVIEMKKFIK